MDFFLREDFEKRFYYFYLVCLGSYVLQMIPKGNHIQQKIIGKSRLMLSYGLNIGSTKNRVFR